MEELKLIENPIENSAEMIFQEEMNSRRVNYHSTNIKYYFTCPHKFKLSREFEVEQISDAFTNGLLLEGYIFGFKDLPGYSEFEIRGLGYNKDGSISKAKGKQDKTVIPIKQRAEYLQQFFDLKNGSSFVKLEYDGKFRNGLLRGEADFVGDHWINVNSVKPLIDLGILNLNNYEQKTIDENYPPFFKKRVLTDLKDTANIYYQWMITKQIQVPQAIFYPYIWYKSTGEILDFVYFISWNKADTIFKQIYFRTTEKTFEIAERLIDEIERDLFFQPDCEVGNCLGRGFGGGCHYIEHCIYGRELIANSQYLDLINLDSPLMRIKDEDIKNFTLEDFSNEQDFE